MLKGDVLTLSNVGVKEQEVEEWREKEFQQNLYEVLRDQRKDFYQILFEIAKDTGKDLPKLHDDEDIRIVKTEYPDLLGSRPDIFVQTSQDRLFCFELKTGEDFDVQQLKRHDLGLRDWCAESERKGYNYIGTILLLNRSSSDTVGLPPDTQTYWIGWDVVYQAMKNLLESKMHSVIRENIDKILGQTPLDEIRDKIKNSLLEPDNVLYENLKEAILTNEFLNVIHSQMGLEAKLKKYKPISDEDSIQDYKNKLSILKRNIERFMKRYVEEIKKEDEWAAYNDYYDQERILRIWLEHGIRLEVNFKLLQDALDALGVKLYIQSAKEKNGPLELGLLPLLKKEGTEIRNMADRWKKIGYSLEDSSANPVTKENADEYLQKIKPILLKEEIQVFGRESDKIIDDVKQFFYMAMELYYLTMKKYREASPEGAQIEIQEEKTEQ